MRQPYQTTGIKAADSPPPSPSLLPFEAPVDIEQRHEAIQEHLELHIGKPTFLFQEVADDIVKINLQIVPPSKRFDFFTIVTSGMSDRAMNPPAGAEDYRFVELVMALPPTWPLHETQLTKEISYWPLRWMKILARFPHEYETWLFYMHTVPNGDPPEPYAINTDMCCAMISVPMLFGSRFTQLQVNRDVSIHFYSVIPLYQEEMDYKLRRGADRLLKRLEAHGVNELLDVHRGNTCKRKLKWWA